MSTDLYPEQKATTEQPESWHAPSERAPSSVRPDEPRHARLVALLSVSALVLAGFILLMHSTGKVTPLGPSLGPNLAWFCLVCGVGGLLFHAARDSDPQVRRLYMGLGYLLLLVGVGASLAPVKGPVGTWFLLAGLPAFLLGLLFQLAYVRHETDEFLAKTSRQVIGGLGAVMALWGFGYGNVALDFLVPQGLVLVLLGLVYLAAFVSLEGVSSDLGFLVARGLGFLGGVVVLLALARSALVSWGVLSGGAGHEMMPGGLVLLIGGLLYLIVSAAQSSDLQLVVMTRREFVRFFYSPIVYFVLFGFTLIGWQLFLTFVFDFLWRGPTPSTVMEPIVAGYIVAWFPIMSVIFVVPVVTMGLMSEENRTGTMEVMLTAPVNEPTIVVSKLLAALAFYLIIWLPWGGYLVALRYESGQPFDYRPLLGFLVALAFTGANFISFGIFFSSLTRNQIIAAVLTFAMMLAQLIGFFVKRDFLTPDSPWAVILTHIGFVELWINSTSGKVATRDLLLHFSAAIFWSYLTVKVLESRKWR